MLPMSHGRHYPWRYGLLGDAPARPGPDDPVAMPRCPRTGRGSAPAMQARSARNDSGVVRQMSEGGGVPAFRQVVLDCLDPRSLAEFYRRLLGLAYRPGDEPPPEGQPDPRGGDWLVLRPAGGAPGLAFQRVDHLPGVTWPDGPVAQQLHLDLTVASVEELDTQHQRVLRLGGRLLHDRRDDPEEPLRVYADPAGHPFCIFVG